MSGAVKAITGGGDKPRMPEPPPTLRMDQAVGAADAARRRAASARGRASTMLSEGQTTPTTATRQLLG